MGKKKKKNSNSLGIHRRARLLRICHALGISDAPGWSNRDLIYALADARKIEIGVSHIQNADTVLGWFEAKEPDVFVKVPKVPKLKTYRLKQDFYKSWEWRTLRMEALKKHGSRCQCCGATANNRAMSGEPVRICVDHIQPLALRWDLRLDPANVQILCDECNQGKGAWDQTDWREPEGSLDDTEQTDHLTAAFRSIVLQ